VLKMSGSPPLELAPQNGFDDDDAVDQLATQVDFSFLDFNTQTETLDPYPDFNGGTQVSTHQNPNLAPPKHHPFPSIFASSHAPTPPTI